MENSDTDPLLRRLSESSNSFSLSQVPKTSVSTSRVAPPSQRPISSPEQVPVSPKKKSNQGEDVEVRPPKLASSRRYSQAISQSGTKVQAESSLKRASLGVTLSPFSPKDTGDGGGTTLQDLLKLCVEAVSTDGTVDKSKEELVTTFLQVHQWFLPSEELVKSFSKLFTSSGDTVPCAIKGCLHTPTSLDCPVQRYKTKICQVIRYWISACPAHFDQDGRCREALEQLGSVLEREGNHTLKQLVDVSKVPSYEWMRNMSVRQSEYGKHARKVSLVFNHLEPDELAAQLTFLEYKAFRRIYLCDYKNYTLTACLRQQPKLERAVALFNGLSQWVQCMVLSKTTPQQRAEVMEKFIQVSKHLRDLQNFNTLMAIVGAVSHSALARLSKTVACLSHDSQQALSEMSELLSSHNNFSNYRRVYQLCQGFKIPILGVHLKDLISLHAAMPDRLEGDLLNLRKLPHLAGVLKELTRLQSQDVCPVQANMDLVNTLKLSLHMFHTEDEIYELSLAREPRGNLPSPLSGAKPIVFADWLSGTSPPEPSTINKHVHDMVEAVFKNYDTDSDGFISNDEFEAIAGNFPFIDSFCVLDTDKDGMISKQEMTSYFIRANSHALRNSFKHAFREMTYFKPTYCIHCTGLLWGLIKQGWKCKDCGINAHKHCKEMVVMECRARGPRRLESSSNEMEEEQVPSPTSKSPLPVEVLPSESSLPVEVLPSQSSLPVEVLPNQANLCQQPAQIGESVFNGIKNLPVLTSAAVEDHQERGLVNRGPFEISQEQIMQTSEEEITRLQRHLTKAQEVSLSLREENLRLKSQLDLARQQISSLKHQLGAVRQNTIDSILEQMEALQPQTDV